MIVSFLISLSKTHDDLSPKRPQSTKHIIQQRWWTRSISQWHHRQTFNTRSEEVSSYFISCRVIGNIHLSPQKHLLPSLLWTTRPITIRSLKGQRAVGRGCGAGRVCAFSSECSGQGDPAWVGHGWLSTPKHSCHEQGREWSSSHQIRQQKKKRFNSTLSWLKNK